jgi:DNA invertase Pin-like site-specific DNA recombinase
MEGELAAVVLRVSSTGKRQSTENQDAPAYGLAAKHGYTVAREIRIKTSAYHGKQQQALDELLDGIRSGEWSVICVSALDRLERRGPFALADWLRAVVRAGGRVESARAGEEWLADTRDEAMWLTRLAWEADRARRESEIRSIRTREGHARKERLGQGWQSLPLGWRYDKRAKFDSSVVADTDAQAAVRAGIEVVASGGTLRDMAAVMAAVGYARTPEQCEAIVKNKSYSTGVLPAGADIEVTPVVDADVQEQAIAAVISRAKMRTPRNRNVNSDDFAGRIYCRKHLRPLHRTYGPKHKDGSRVRYYRAKWPDGSSCGCGIFNADELDNLTDWIMFMQGQPEYEVVVTGGDPSEVARVEAAIVKLAKKRPEGWMAAMAELDERLTALKSGKVQRVRRETGRDMGEVWRSMNRQQQRRYLERQVEAENFHIVFWRREDGKVRGVPLDFEGNVMSQGYAHEDAVVLSN